MRDLFPYYSDRVEEFEPDSIYTDAAHLQFKSDGNGNGVTKQLFSVKQWEPGFAGIVFVWESLSGIYYIADGHQRLALALRLKRTPAGDPIMLWGYKFREADGWTIEKMRVFAAAKNIAEGGESTKAIDVAKLLRNGGPVEFLEQHISSQRRCYTDGKALANLGDDAFKLVLNHIVPETWGIEVGRKCADPAEQVSIFDFLKHYRPRSEEVADLVDEALAAGFFNERQNNLFGETDWKHGLIAERVAIYKHCRKLLKAQMRALDGALKVPDVFQACGIEINPATLKGESQLKGIMRDMLKQARMKGEDLSAVLTRAARDHKMGIKLETAAVPFLKAAESVSRRFMAQDDKKDAANGHASLGILENQAEPTLPVALIKDTGEDGIQLGFV